MDAERFDRVAKVVGTRTARRGLLLGVVGAALGRALAVGPAAARPKCLPVGATCKPGDCCPDLLCLRPTHDAPEGRCVNLVTCRRNKACPPLWGNTDCRNTCFDQMTACLKPCPETRACLDRCQRELLTCLGKCTTVGTGAGRWSRRGQG
jgi:hypothetical protein